MQWKKDLQNNIRDVAELEAKTSIVVKDREGYQKLLETYPMSVTDYYLSLIDFNDPDDPIRKMCIPSLSELSASGFDDTSGEQVHTVVEGMQHKYQQTVMILSNHNCAMYCRHCFRKRMVGASASETAKEFKRLLTYIKEHKQITNTLISGGDSFLSDNEVIEQYLKEFTEIDHLDFIRFGTRTPVVFPQRITEDEELQNILKKYAKRKAIYIVTHFNHPREFTDQSAEAIKVLKECGLTIKNQTVLLKGVNDYPETLSEVLKNLTRWGVSPYYIFQCRPVKGAKDLFQVPIKQGIEIINQVNKLQDGLGKSYKYAMSHEIGKIEIVGNLDEKSTIFKYHQAKNIEDTGKVFLRELGENECWLENKGNQ